MRPHYLPNERLWPLRSTDYRYGVSCPECAGPKHPQAVRCWRCRNDPVQVEARRLSEVHT